MNIETLLCDHLLTNPRRKRLNQTLSPAKMNNNRIAERSGENYEHEHEIEIENENENGEARSGDISSNKSHESVISRNQNKPQDLYSSTSSVDNYSSRDEAAQLQTNGGRSHEQEELVSPKSPRINNSRKLNIITPPSPENESVVYSDSDDLGSQSSLDLQSEDGRYTKRDIGQQLRSLARAPSSEEEGEENEQGYQGGEGYEINVTDLVLKIKSGINVDDDGDDIKGPKLSSTTTTSSSSSSSLSSSSSNGDKKEKGSSFSSGSTFNSGIGSGLNLKPSFKIDETPKKRNGPSSSTTPKRSRFSSRLRRKSRSKGAEGLFGSEEETPSGGSTRLRRARRKSREPSEKSHRSYDKPGTGYTSMPPSGKVFRNLLILEESLREQVIQQKAMRRKYLIFLSILCSIIAALTHHLYILDSSISSTGTMRIILQFFLISTVMTLLLYHLSGEYRKTIVVPRRFLSLTNKGLRQLNVRLVKIKTPFTDKVTDQIREISLSIVLFALKIFHIISPTSIQNKDSKIEVFLVTCQSQCQPRIGVADVKLLLNARVFNIDIREGWEIYRSEFWVNEGVRRRNNMLAFINGNQKQEKSKLVRRKRKSSSISPQAMPSKLSEQNLMKLNSKLESEEESRNHSLDFDRAGSPLKSEISRDF